MDTLSIVKERSWEFEYKKSRFDPLMEMEKYIKIQEDKKIIIFLRILERGSHARKKYLNVQYQVVIGIYDNKLTYEETKKYISDYYEYLALPHLHAKYLIGPMYGFDKITNAYEFIEEVINTIENIKIESGVI